MTLISLHLPKTAGTSFRASLKARFADFYRDDYSDGGISLPARERIRSALSAGEVLAEQGLGEIDCVHGHFLPMKYLLLGRRRDLTFVTWMREPVARMLSHYQYWRESYDEKTAMPHHRQVIEEKWTLEQFCLSRQFRNIYTQYLWGFSVENFAFIGVSEHYEADMLEFAERFLAVALSPQHLNPTKYLSAQRGLAEPLLQKVRDFHAADIRLYQRALQLRQARHGGGHLRQPRDAVAP